MKVENLIPEVYYKESRDFAYIGRLAEIIFNYMKTGADCISSSIYSQNASSLIVSLMSETLGFELKHVYSDKDLMLISTAFASILKIKGVLASCDLLVRLIVNGQGLEVAQNESCALNDEGCELIITVPSRLSDLSLLTDVFDYILPVGMTYKIIKADRFDPALRTSIIGYTTSDSSARSVKDVDLGAVRIKDASVDSDGDNRHLLNFYTGVVVTDPSDGVIAIDSNELPDENTLSE